MPREITHKLLYKDPIKMQGVCAKCGPTPLCARAGRAGGEKALACQTARKERRKERRKATRSGHPFQDLRRAHGMTHEEAQAYLASRSCEICGTRENLAVDHCHDTGKVRGALCRRHNLGLGQFKDDLDHLRKAITYLEQHRQ